MSQGLQKPSSAEYGAWDQDLLRELECGVVEATTSAFDLVSKRFRGQLDVSLKSDESGQTLVTDVDRESQAIVARIIEKRFPDHMLLGEEDAPDVLPAASDFVWAVDPIDGTTNFVNGSFIYAVSIAVLHRGVPVVGAIQIPWLTTDGSALIHARAGAGAWWGEKRVKIPVPEGDGAPEHGRLASVPASMGRSFRVERALRESPGELRVTGSIAHEMFMIATGSLQYGLCGHASVWDFAAGALVVKEAGGTVLSLDGKAGWIDLRGWGLPYKNDPDTTNRMRSWRGMILAGPANVTRFVAGNLTVMRPGIVRRAMRLLKR